MLDDLLEFAALTLVDGGRLSFWMPTANDEDVILGVPAHQCLDLVSVCVQTFNKCAFPAMNFASSTDEDKKGSRRLLTYRRLPDSEIKGHLSMRQKEAPKGSNANDLNSFRKRVSCIPVPPWTLDTLIMNDSILKASNLQRQVEIQKALPLLN